MSMSMPGREKQRKRSSPEPQTQPPSRIPSSLPDNLSSLSTRPTFPPGYKYLPNDVDLIEILLGRKHYFEGNNYPLINFYIHRVNIYDSNPEQLSVEYEKANDKEWFFLSERNKMGKAGKKQKRGGNGGYWHATVATKTIDEQGVIGYKKPLKYYVGKRPNGEKTEWLMHEYSVDQSSADDEKDYALCKIYRSTQEVNKKKSEEEENERQKKASEEKVEQQPRTIDSRQAQQFPQAPLDCYQPQPCDSAYQQRQFWPGPLDSYQPHPHHIAYEQLIFQPAPLDSYQPQPRDLAYQQQPFAPGTLDSYQPQPHDIGYQQLRYRMTRTLEEEYGLATQHQQLQQMNLRPPLQGQCSRTGMVMTHDDLFDMSNDERFFDIDELFNNGEEHGVATQQQQQYQSAPSSPPPPPPPPQGQDSMSGMVMTDQDWSDILNGQYYFNFDELL